MRAKDVGFPPLVHCCNSKNYGSNYHCNQIRYHCNHI